jgi:hypothetical protein
MNRRDFVAVGAMIAGAHIVRGLTATSARTRRGAVAIGVDKSGDLPRLKAAGAGALAVAKWLDGEGFEVTSLTDATGPVTADNIFRAVEPFVERGTLDQLVIYFAGHGFVCAYSEYWLLSGAPHNPNEAVSVVESVALAKRTGIPSVVIISDACRSTVASLGAQSVHGNLIFPSTETPPDQTSKVDVFYATLVGDPAWELPVGTSAAAYEGIFTSTFLDAFKRPDAAMVRTVKGEQVVPNFQLGPYLIREVPKRAQAKLITLKQRPEVEVVSDWNTFIGRVLTKELAPPDANPLLPTMRDVAAVELQAVGLGINGINPAQNTCKGVNSCRSSWNTCKGQSACKGVSRKKWSRQLAQLARESGFAETRKAIAKIDTMPEEWLVRTGLVINGRKLVSVLTTPTVSVQVRDVSGLSLVEVDLGQLRAAGVVVRFADGSGAVITALDRYVGNVVVDDQGVANVSYLPSRDNPMWDIYRGQQQKLIEAHAAIAASARSGVFRIDGEQGFRDTIAQQLSDRIRVLKGVDPTLGLYAAYAYTDAGFRDRLVSLRDAMLENLGVDLFDLEMLSRPFGSDGRQGRACVPFCPMLSQGWSLLRVQNVRLHPGLAAARDHLRSALWTSFDPEGTRIVEDALRTQS